MNKVRTFEDHYGLNLRPTQSMKNKENRRPRITSKVTKCIVIHQASLGWAPLGRNYMAWGAPGLKIPHFRGDDLKNKKR